jgi:hypothetical protein
MGSAVVVGAVSSRLKVPSTPSVETQPMSFEPLRDLVKRKDEFEEEPQTIKRDVPIPPPAFAPSRPFEANGAEAHAAVASPPPLPVEAAKVPPVVPMGEFAPMYASAIAPSPAFAPAPAPALPRTLPRRFLVYYTVATSVAATLLLVVLFVTRRHHATPVPPPPPPVPTAAAPAPSPPTPIPTAAAASSPPPATSAPEPEAPPQNLPAFSAPAARHALDATSRDVAKCRRGKIWGVGAATVTFASDGTVSNVALGTPFRGTPAGECAATEMSAAHVPPFGAKQGTLVYKFFVALK